MAGLVRTLILCGLLSGTQPITIMGLLLVMTGTNPRRQGMAYLCGAFLVESSILLFSSLVLSGTIEPRSGTGHLFFIIRIVLGVLLLAFGLRMRRPPKRPQPEVPKSLERVRGLSPGKSFFAGAALADYQGPVIASLALTTASVSLGGRLVALGIYTLFASGIPVVVYIVTLRSRQARDKMNDATNWVLLHRRGLASWLAIVLGLFLVADALLALLRA
jgi:hypothetical protein